MITKEQWLKAYETTLKEYEDKVHTYSNRSCAKCILVGDPILDNINCKECPEHIHNINEYGYGCGCGCSNRLTSAGYSSILNINDTNAIIHYHKLAIKYIKTNKRFNFKRFKRYLIKADKIAYGKYNK